MEVEVEERGGREGEAERGGGVEGRKAMWELGGNSISKSLSAISFPLVASDGSP